MQASPAIKLSRQPRSAFTLVELLVSIAVLSLLVVLLGGVFSQVSRAWIVGEGSIEKQRGARALADFIGAELRGAMLPLEKRATNSPPKGNLQFVINPPTSQVPVDYRNADTIFWQAPLATETSFGDLAEIGYFVQWDETDPVSPRPALCRFFVNPSRASDASSGNPADPSGRPLVEPNLDFLIYDADPRKWLSEGLLNKYAPATKKSGYLGLFAENVVGFWVRAYGVDGAQLPRSFDSRTGYPAGAPRYYLPGRVQVSFAQIDSHHAQRLAPVWETVRDLSRDTATRDAGEFVAAMRAAADQHGALRAILPGIRIYTTEVHLENAR